MTEPNTDNLPNNAELIQPCEWYLEEHRDCRSIKSKFHQYFIFGETLSCDQYRRNYDNCMLFREKRDAEAAKAVIKNELEKIDERQQTIVNNNVWKLRKEPPTDWTKPLPDYISKGYAHSYLKLKSDELKAGIDSPKSSCVIS